MGFAGTKRWVLRTRDTVAMEEHLQENGGLIGSPVSKQIRLIMSSSSKPYPNYMGSAKVRTAAVLQTVKCTQMRTRSPSSNEGFYRRVLPSPPAIEFDSIQGKQLFAEAFQEGHMEGYFKLSPFYQTQSEPAYCGLASLSMVLNALGIDPGRKWKGPWRWFDECMLDCCESLEKIKSEGICLGKLACLAHFNGAKVEAFRTNQSTITDFLKYVMTCTSSEDCLVITTFYRPHLKQTGYGHISPIGGYHSGSDMVLIMDVARFKYLPHWVPLSLLWEAMDTIVETTGHRRGFMLVSRPHKEPSLLYSLGCIHETWIATAKYLLDNIPFLLKLEDFKDVQEILSVTFVSLPINFWEFIKWVEEFRRREERTSVLSREKRRLAIKDQVLGQVHETELYKHVTKWLSSKHSHQIKTTSSNDATSCDGYYLASSDILTVLLLALPPCTWSNLKDAELLKEINSLVSIGSLPCTLQKEVLNLRQHLHFLIRDLGTPTS
ncbi:PREDICTED: glutathione gamma-glutamylcysteinyltransferase 1-like [Nelumbo nucifera]|uniref:glutathione gamma-glutamylcysteinyltransferase n=1 Tax=Nelumbo nucifera TaxID=4432 RepID=A0A1U8Q6N4_NELNU|nr:PREDICTED: glutathione gamma-glutamylcysteinyltransferase 1-like [Nelumbo nucifera]